MRPKYLLTILLLFMLGTACLYAQPNSASVFDEVTDTPVNGGLITLLIAGVGYGVKKLYNKNKA